MNKTNLATANVISMPTMVAEDDRGIIEQLAEGSYQSVLRITSKAGTIRANHYHKHDSHLCYLVSGKLRYLHRRVDDESAPLEEIIIQPGQLFYTAPMIAHVMQFLEDSEFYCFTTQPRGQDQYEEDTVRIKLI